MPTRQEHDAHSALFQEAVAMYETAKAECERVEKLKQTTVAKNRAPTTLQLSDVESARAKLSQARARLSNLERRHSDLGRGDMRLSPHDLAIAAAACRALADTLREDAKAFGSAAISSVALERAHHAERLAVFFELERERERN
jgi:hypothetical protein